MFDSFSHVMLYADDLGRAVAWYEKVLGFQPRFVAPGQYASLWHPGMKVRMDLHPTGARPATRIDAPIPYFLTRDIEVALAELRKRGVKASDPKREGHSPRFASFIDSEGNCLGLEEHA